MRVLVVHNRYRYAGGEERAVELQLAALERAGIPSAALMRDSGTRSAGHVARSMLRGGDRPDEVERAVRELGATVAHFHNMHPLFGHRGIEAARRAGARTVLHLHNYRLFCAIAIAFREGSDCFRCRGRRTLPGFVHNCRGSLAESAVYATALSLYQPSVIAAVDTFITPSRYAADRLVRLGVPRERLPVVANYIPDHEVAERSRAADGAYALVAGRLSVEKGVAYAIDAAHASGVPLKIAGDGPLERELRERARGAGPVEFIGRVDRAEVRRLLDGAAMALVPSISGDVMPFAALEAMAAGVPVVASDAGSLPEIVGPDGTIPRKDSAALADRMRALFADPDARRREGDAALERVRMLFGEGRYVGELRAVYERASSQNTGTPLTLESTPWATP
jgi:glycosyltransferase involved in cell wall biosynthesis